jgi:hypothetical protein
MSIRGLLYQGRCDHCGALTAQMDSQFTVDRWMRDNGWSMGVRLNGERAKRGGLDYCPECSRRRWPS